MGLVQQMEEECDCVEVIFQDYIQARRTIDIFLFFEGKDDYKYYWCRISPFMGNQAYRKYNCNCKINVVTLYEMISKRTKVIDAKKTLYFVDKDFEKSDDLPIDIYVTPTYSIENFYFSDNAIKNMIIGEWGLSGEMDNDDEKDFTYAVNFLISKRNEIIDSMIYANAWYSLQYNKTKHRYPYPKLSAIKEYKTIKNVKNKELLQNLVPNSVEVTNKELENEIIFLREKPVERLRGKYFEQSMPYYIRFIFAESNKKDGGTMFIKRRKVNINVGTDNLLSVLSNYADVPSDLINYIKTRFE